MTKKDYVLIASILFEASKSMTLSEKRRVMEHACNLLTRDNPAFDRVRFTEEWLFPRINMRKILKEV